MDRVDLRLVLSPVAALSLAVFLACVVVSTLSSAAATAVRNSCAGKYVDAARMVDAAMAKYGTLYSGGLHHMRLDEIGATIDLYRLWRGLPDAGLGGVVDQFEFHDAFGEFKRAIGIEAATRLQDIEPETLWQMARWALHDATAPDDASRFSSVWVLDLLTSLGPALDWHRRADLSGELTPWQAWLAEKAVAEPSLDWLQVALTASNAPWANHRHLAFGMNPLVESAYGRLSTRALARFEAGDGLEWLVAAAISAPGRFREAAVDRSLLELRASVVDCSATPAAYAAYAVGIGVRGRFNDHRLDGSMVGEVVSAYLPTSIRRKLATDHLYLAVLRNVAGGRGRKRIDYPSYAALFPGDRAWERMIEHAKLYDPKHFRLVAGSSSAYYRRAYNLLSADALLRMGETTNDTSLIVVAFARLIAMKEWAAAEALAPVVAKLDPNFAATINQFLPLDEPLSVRLALIAIYMPRLSTIVAGGDAGPDVALSQRNSAFGIDDSTEGPARHLPRRRNLPTEYRSGAFLQRDFEVWLRAPRSWRGARPFQGMRGATIPWTERSSRRGGGSQAFRAPRLFTESPPNSLPKPQFYRGTPELMRLAGDERLLHTAGREIIRWAAKKTSNVFKRVWGDHTLESEALARLIQVCRFEYCGRYNHAPTEDRAFRLLVGRMSDTKAARATRYWWKRVK